MSKFKLLKMDVLC